MASPVVTSDGEFIALYPSYEPINQGPFAHLFLAGSITAVMDVYHTDAYSGSGNMISNPFVKRGSLLKSNPSNSDHLAYFFLKGVSTETDIYFMESYDRGQTWSTQARINQDTIGNGILQDLVWADFDIDGDLAVCWRDRRSGSGTGYAQNTEIYGVTRWHNSSAFNNEFVISDQAVGHNSVLEESGNDFMSVRFINDTLYCVWGDVRSGNLCIYLNKTSLISGTSSNSLIHSDSKSLIVYPNPATNEIYLKNGYILERFIISSSGGNVLLRGENASIIHLNGLSPGIYTLEMVIKGKTYISNFMKE